MGFKRYFLLFIGVAFSVLSLAASREWSAQNVPIPFLKDSTQYVSDPDGLVGKTQKDSANLYLQKLKLECGVQNGEPGCLPHGAGRGQQVWHRI